MKKQIEITLYATVDDDFDLLKFWDDIGCDKTSQFIRIQNPGYRDIKESK